MDSITLPRMPTDELQALIDNARLPTMPQATLRIMELASDPLASLDQVSSVVATDPTLAGRVLGLANSALLCRGKRFESLDRAVIHLGVMRIRSLALALRLFAFKPKQRLKSFDFGYYWRYCLACAVAAKLIAGQTGEPEPEEAFVAGLLMDIGILALQEAHPHEYAKILKAKARSSRRRCELEYDAWGYDHADIGAAIAAYWGLPRRLGDAIRLHHRPANNSLVSACHLADVVHAVIYEVKGAGAVRLIDELRDGIPDKSALLREMQAELPHIADSCACPAWTPSTERELKNRIAKLFDADATD
jgi:HD-like signal output (HDOD) protein